MSDPDALGGDPNLQFDRAVSSRPSAPADAPAVTCVACHSSIADEYYDVNGQPVCARCRSAVEAAAETPAGVGPFAIATACGFFAAVAGAIIYYVILAYANLEIGIVAVLIGYMVGYSVRKGARGGGLRFQILAVSLTYASVALAYTPLVIRGAVDSRKKTEATEQSQTVNDSKPVAPAPSGGQSVQRLDPFAAVVGVAFLIAFAAALPIMVIFSSFPSGLISAVILFVGLRQAWKMTAAPHVQVLGPYRVGPAVAPTST